ncbi:TPA: ferrous iron transport protein A [Streptococcus suis]|nr:ferrous iron transport protein A [Streptococcus suis]HEL1587419.1 ferrous iron transport protein A [Streptococcus suis]
MDFTDLQVGSSYRLVGMHFSDSLSKHLQQLGFLVGQDIRIISKTKANIIVQVKASRLALDKDLMEGMDLVASPSQKSLIPLSQVAIGSQVILEQICATGALKRRLMDMGLTKGTAIYLKKLAPLGDPLEITIRGYQLSLRKSEAQLLFVSLQDEVFE